jgi:hypothetical protein
MTITASDHVLPALNCTCPDNIQANNDTSRCGASVVFPPAMVVDNCADTWVAQTSGPASSSFIGVSNVGFTAIDQGGNVCV